MLDMDIFQPDQVDAAATCFWRDGFVAVANVFTPEQLQFAQAGARRVVQEQTSAVAAEDANRGFARYSFGPQIHHREWTMLIDLPTVLPIVDAIWGSTSYTCSDAGGDYCLPGAAIQPLHSDVADFFADPAGQVTVRDVPAPFIVVNFTMCEFRETNGAIRLVPGTQRSREAIPSLDDEPQAFKDNLLCAPPGTAIIRDVRCWHGGTANRSDEARVMTSVGYFAPWFGNPNAGTLPRERYLELSDRGKELSRCIVEHEFARFEVPAPGQDQ